MVEHTVIVDSIGGTAVLSCEGLGIKNIEYPFKELTAEGIKKTILDYKYMTEEHADFDLKVEDNRPEKEPYRDVQERESKNFSKNHNKLATHN